MHYLARRPRKVDFSGQVFGIDWHRREKEDAGAVFRPDGVRAGEGDNDKAAAGEDEIRVQNF